MNEKPTRDYLEHQFDLNDPGHASAYDDLPLWSAPCGLMLLDKVKIRPHIRVLDVGCGTGFPLIELGQRLGSTCEVHGIDPWAKAIELVNQKTQVMGVGNVRTSVGFAEDMPFEDDFFDLIVSNNGINNVNDEENALSECARVAKPGAQMILTWNLPDTFKEFYSIFEETLRELSKGQDIEMIWQHIRAKRKTAQEVRDMIQKVGFRVMGVQTNALHMRFVDGTSMFRHFYIKSFFVSPWVALIDPEDVDGVFERLEENLNTYAEARGELSLTVPIACMDCQRE
jgi:ubiquinone/menaquinone biosynthesis C-methylase UbiE